MFGARVGNTPRSRQTRTKLRQLDGTENRRIYGVYPKVSLSDVVSILPCCASANVVASGVSGL